MRKVRFANLKKKQINFQVILKGYFYFIDHEKSTDKGKDKINEKKGRKKLKVTQ